MRRSLLLPALCLMLSILTACGSEPAQTTAPDVAPPVQTQPMETTVPTVTDPIPGNGKFIIQLPEGYEASVEEEDWFVFVSPDAPEDNSTVTVRIQERDESVLTMSNSEYRKRIDVTRQEGSEALRFKLIDMQNDTVDGFPAVVSEYNLVYEDYISHIFTYEIVSRGSNFVFTFTDNTEDNVWLDQFQDCITTVQLNQKEGSTANDYAEMSLYELDCGLRLFAEKGLTEHDARDFTECLGNRNVIILFMADNKEANHLTTMDLEGYAQLLRQTNDLSGFDRDVYNNLYTTFHTTSEDGTDYFNMLFVKETEDAFWVCQMACNAESQSRYEKEFALWASSITETE